MARCKNRITIRAKPKTHFGDMDDYEILFDGKVFSELAYNMTGYVGYLPVPKSDGGVGKFDIGERRLSTYRKQIAEFNKEWCELRSD